MVELMEKAISKLTSLPAAKQETLAQWILDELEELEDEQRWDVLFANSQDALAKMAKKALAEYHAGLTVELDPDTLPD